MKSHDSSPFNAKNKKTSAILDEWIIEHKTRTVKLVFWISIYDKSVQFWQLNQSNNNLKCVETNLRNKKSLTRVGSTPKTWTFERFTRAFSTSYKSSFWREHFDKNTGNWSAIFVNGMNNGERPTESNNTFTTVNSWSLTAIYINFHSSDKHIDAAGSTLLG